MLRVRGCPRVCQASTRALHERSVADRAPTAAPDKSAGRMTGGSVCINGIGERYEGVPGDRLPSFAAAPRRDCSAMGVEERSSLIEGSR